MRFDPPLLPAILVRRYQRFLADVTLPGGETMTLHCPNTGSMRHCNQPGSRVLYSDSGNVARKYRYTLEAVSTPSGAWAGINTARANRLVEELLRGDAVESLCGYRELRREQRYGNENSRIDFLLTGHSALPDCYLEVKNVTLEEGKECVSFPDAVTERGARHLRELIQVVKSGRRGVLFFCVQHSSAQEVSPAWEIDPQYSAALEEAVNAGVEVIARGADISPAEICLRRNVRFLLRPESGRGV